MDEARFRLWFMPGKRRFYAIPEDAELPEGEAVLRRVPDGQRCTSTEAAIADLEVSRDEAMNYVQEDVRRGFSTVLRSLEGLADVSREHAASAGKNLGGDAEEAAEKVADALRDLGKQVVGALQSPEVEKALDTLGTRLRQAASDMRTRREADDVGDEAEADGGDPPEVVDPDLADDGDEPW